MKLSVARLPVVALPCCPVACLLNAQCLLLNAHCPLFNVHCRATPHFFPFYSIPFAFRFFVRVLSSLVGYEFPPPRLSIVRCYSSATLNGFSICSLPSTGERRTRRVPRATMRPRGRVEELPSSSVFVVLAVRWGFWGEI